MPQPSGNPSDWPFKALSDLGSELLAPLSPCYAIVDTRNWLPGKKVLVSSRWLKDINWADRKAVTDLKQEDIKNGPHFDPAAPVNREYEESLYDFHGRPKYWTQ